MCFLLATLWRREAVTQVLNDTKTCVVFHGLDKDPQGGLHQPTGFHGPRREVNRLFLYAKWIFFKIDLTKTVFGHFMGIHDDGLGRSAMKN